MKILFVSSGNSKDFDVVPFIKAQGDSLIKLGHDVTFFTIQGKGFKGYIKNIPRLRNYLKNKHFDLVHAHFSYCGWVAFLTGTKIPKILSLMGGDAYGDIYENGQKKIKTYFMILQGQLIQHFYNEIIVKSDNLSKYVRKKTKCTIIPNGVDYDIFKPMDKIECRNKLSLKINKKILLFMGDPKNPRKNIKLLKDAVRYLDNKEYQIVNPYPVDHKEVPLYMNACDVLVFPSYLEGSPNIIKEAMACNTKIVATLSGDIEERANGVNNIWIADFDKIDLAQKIQLADEYDGDSNSREKTQIELDEKVVASQIVEIYKRLLSR